MIGIKGFRVGLGVSAILGLGLLLGNATPASADPPRHARAYGYHRHDSHRGHSSHNCECRDNRWSSRSSSRYDLDRDGIPNRRDRDIDGDRVPNRYDRNDYQYDRYSRDGRSSRWPGSMDRDRDGTRDRYDRYDSNPRRR